MTSGWRISLGTVQYVQRSSAYRLIGCFVPFGSRGSSARKSERRRQLSLYTCLVRRIQYYYYYSYCRFFFWFFKFFVWITVSISMYIVCVCLFSALSSRVGALQMSIIIIHSFCIALFPPSWSRYPTSTGSSPFILKTQAFHHSSTVVTAIASVMTFACYSAW